MAPRKPKAAQVAENTQGRADAAQAAEAPMQAGEATASARSGGEGEPLPATPTETPASGSAGGQDGAGGLVTSPQVAPPAPDPAAEDGGGPLATEERPEQGIATVISPIAHDGVVYLAGDQLLLTRPEFERLRLAGAVADEDFDDLPIPF